MGIEKEKADFESWATDKFPIAGLGQFEKHNNGTYIQRSIRNMYEAWQAAKAHETKKLDGCVVVSNKLQDRVDTALALIDTSSYAEIERRLPDFIDQLKEALRGQNDSR